MKPGKWLCFQEGVSVERRAGRGMTSRGMSADKRWDEVHSQQRDGEGTARKMEESLSAVSLSRQSPFQGVSCKLS